MVITARSPLFLALVLAAGLVLLLAPAVTAIPPYIALDYLAVGGVCIAVVLVMVIPGRRMRDLRVLLPYMRWTKTSTKVWRDARARGTALA
jgi:Flp pilus assembly protein protease CpaA